MPAPGRHFNRCTAEAPAAVIPDVQGEIRAPLPWSDRGNVLTPIGGVVLTLARGP